MSTLDISNDIVLEFGHIPNSPYYARALQIAQSISTYRCEGSGRQLRHLVNLKETESDSWFYLYELVEDWKFSLVSRGQLIEKARDNQYTFRCYIERYNATEKEVHCFKNNWIGCQKLTEGHSLLLENEAGEFLDQNRFQPNKEAIKKRVAGEKRLGLCPAFSLDSIYKQIDSLQSIINLSENEDWEPIAEIDQFTDVLHLTGISPTYKRDVLQSPEVVHIDDYENLSIRRKMGIYGTNEFWEHKIVILSRSEWLELAHDGTIPQITKLGDKGWNLLTVLPMDQEIHCIFQRKRFV